MSESANTTQLDAIRAAFKRYFNAPDVELPQTLYTHGVVKKGDWHIAYRLDESETGEPTLDFFAENRHTNSRHVRITATGEYVTLENYQDALIFAPGEEDWGKAATERDENNNKVTEILKSKGLLK